MAALRNRIDAAILFAAILLVIVIGSMAAARETHERGVPIQVVDWRVHDAGNVGCLITNWSQIGSRPGSQAPYANAPSAEWPRDSGVEYLWTSGLWVGALVDGVPHVTVGAFENEFAPSSLPVDRIYATAAGAAGGNRIPASGADDDGDGSIDEDRLDGIDNDGDGLVDEDFAAISDQMFTCEYGDTDPAIQLRYPLHVPLGLRVRQSSLVWARPDIDDFIGLDLEISNTGSDRLAPLYLGFFADFDIGRRDLPQVQVDDRAAFWEGTVHVVFEGVPRDVPISLGYMFDSDGDAGQTPGYIGCVFLGASSPRNSQEPTALRNFRLWKGNVPYEQGGDPVTDSQRFETLAGLSPQSLPPPDGGPRPPFVAAQDGDYRVLVSIGPVDRLDPGESMHVAAAMVLGEGLDGLLQNAARARLLYEGVIADCDGDPITPEQCAVHWTTEATVPILVEEMAAAWRPDGVHLEWKLAGAALPELRSVHVERGAVAGPFERVSLEPLRPDVTMRFTDAAPQLATSWYRLALEDRSGQTTVSSPVHVEPAAAANRFFLEVPTSLGPDAMLLRYGIGQRAGVTIRIYDIRGRLVRTLPQGRRDPGSYAVPWDVRDARGVRPARGMYLLQLDAGGVFCQRKMLLSAR